MLQKRLIKQLVMESYTHGQLDEGKINKIVSHLKFDELKLYVKALKYMEKKSSVLVETPMTLTSENMQTLQGMFENKRVVYNVNPELLLGMKVVDGDDVYDMSLKNKLAMVEKFLEENYD